MKKPTKLNLSKYAPDVVHAWILAHCKNEVRITTSRTSAYSTIQIVYNDQAFSWDERLLLRDLTELHANGVVGHFQFENALERARFEYAFPR